MLFRVLKAVEQLFYYYSSPPRALFGLVDELDALDALCLDLSSGSTDYNARGPRVMICTWYCSDFTSRPYEEQ